MNTLDRALYRGKCVETGTWCIGSLNIFEDSVTINLCKVINANIGQPENIQVEMDVVPETVGQFTGLTDKNGKRIFEGDIIEFTYWFFDGDHSESTLTGHIVYSCDCMSFQLKGVKNEEWERHTGYVNDADYLTPFSELNFEEADFCVIGNIHDNPELIELSK